MRKMVEAKDDVLSKHRESTGLSLQKSTTRLPDVAVLFPLDGCQKIGLVFIYIFNSEEQDRAGNGETKCNVTENLRKDFLIFRFAVHSFFQLNSNSINYPRVHSVGFLWDDTILKRARKLTTKAYLSSLYNPTLFFLTKFRIPDSLITKKISAIRPPPYLNPLHCLLLSNLEAIVRKLKPTSIRVERKRKRENRMSADWGPVVVAVALFILLSPGLLFQLPARTRVVEFGNMYTSGIAILVHAIIYFCIITILIIAIASIDVNMNNQDENGIDSEKDESMNSYSHSIRLQTPKVHTPVAS
ncbi:hypothetical protein SADUNF_Sadunf16G0206700 [Salix dunnii]|uniref:Uncharacterized protein n=1 Tax=Salix dunnii TaxID=1413687 RepID=A0A835MQT3_9ROSI|nr:hypothetical protein SADUNF_Sadunf16G0206700 [Salix dunnii]